MKKSVEMKKKIISIMLCVLMVVGLMPMMPEVMKAETAVEGTDYTVTTDANDVKTYTVYTEAGLLAWNAYAQNNLNTNLILGADITLTDRGEEPNWTPVGDSDNRYTGTVDGQGYTISNLKVNKNNQHVGFIGWAKGATIKNLTLVDVDITYSGSDMHGAGGIAGSAGDDSTISNCRVLSGTIKGRFKTGGIAGGIGSNSTVFACLNAATVSGKDTLGGIVGQVSEGTVVACGNISEGLSASQTIGGIVGEILSEGKVYASWTVSTLEDGESADKDGVGKLQSSGGTISNTKVYTNETSVTQESVGNLNDGITASNVTVGATWRYTAGQYPELVCDTHEWRYTVDGTNTIKAHCVHNCAEADGGSVTISAPTSLIYDGQSKAAIVTKTNYKGAELTINYAVKDGGEMNATPTAAGTYIASITVGGKAASVEYTIQPKEVTNYTAPTANTLTYNGSPQNLVSAGTVGDSGFHMEYSLDGSNYSADIPTATDAGNYTVYSRAVGENTTNYKTKVFDPVNVEIKKAAISINNVTAKDKNYDGKNTVGITAVTISGVWNADVVSVDWTKLTGKLSSANAGTYDSVTLEGLNAEGVLTGADAKNYQITVPSGAVDLATDVTISKVTATVASAPIAKGLTYNGAAQALVLAGTTEDGTFVYSLTKDGTYTETIPAATEVGDYTIWYYVKGDANHTDSEKLSIKVTIKEGPHIENEEGKMGWDAIIDEIEDVIADDTKDTVTVDMNGTTVVSGDVLEKIKGKDVTVEFDLGDGIVWTVNGKDVTATDIADIDFAVTISTQENPINTIPVTVLNAVTGEKSHTEISLAHNGEFGFKAVLSINLEAKNAGLFANLYYFNPTKQAMEFICADEIAADGTADLTFTHASDYTIVIDSVAANAEKPSSPNTGDNSNVALWSMLLVAGLGLVVLGQRKRVK